MILRILNILFLLILPFFFLGTINKVKAFWAGRKGPSILQPFHDFIRLLKKGAVISSTTTLIFQISPSVNFAAIFMSGIIVPMTGHTSIYPFSGDFILFAYILGLGKFFSILGAMDTGSSFEGMGASREAAFSSLVEPAFFIIMAIFASITGNYSFEGILSLPYWNNGLMTLILIITFSSLFIMILTESCRIPVDDPNTHLELTMIHEVMVLDNSGPDLALINYGAGIKMVVLTSIITNLIIPKELALNISIPAFLGLQLITASLIGCVESLIARLRMTHVPQFVLLMTSLALIALSLTAYYIYGGKI